MILIIDDDSSIRSSLTFMLKRAGYITEAVSMPDEAIAAVRRCTPSLILMDMNYSLSTNGEEGLMLLRKIKVLTPETPVILITAWGSIQLAVQGMRAGAFDFVTKPWNNVALMQRIETALKLSEEKNIEQTDKATFDRSGIIGNSKELTNLLDTIERIACTNAPVLITGESGTGKELIAEALHRNSLRRNNPFVKVNLGGISQSLFESEMFGHKRGAFTDAVSDREGRFGMADKGTIFLDEIGELDQASQVKLLRVLQEQTFEMLGDSTPRKVDIRVVCATNANLQKMVQEHTFREDLFYRINLITVHLPALRERRNDIPLLAHHFADKQSKANNRECVNFTTEAIEYLKSLPYPGNIRELKNLIERTILMNNKQTIDADDIRAQYIPVTPHEATASTQPLKETERHRIEETLRNCRGNISQAAAELGITRQALYRRIEKYGIKL